MNKIEEALEMVERTFKYSTMAMTNNAFWIKLRDLLRQALQDDGWVSVKDRLPKSKEEVLTYRPYSSYEKVNTTLFIGGCFVTDDEITHWQPKPNPPQDGSKEEVMQTTQIKIADLEGKALDWAVGKIKGFINSAYCYSGDPALWGQLMEENKISPECLAKDGSNWAAENYEETIYETGPTPGIAICRCFVAMNTEGDSVNVPMEVVG